MIRIPRRKQIIRNVHPQITPLTPPLRHIRNTLHLRYLLLRSQKSAGVWKGLDTVLLPRPRPIRVPADAVGVDAVDVGALRPGAGGGAPFVVVEVPALGVVGLGCAADGLGEGGGEEG